MFIVEKSSPVDDYFIQTKTVGVYESEQDALAAIADAGFVPSQWNDGTYVREYSWPQLEVRAYDVGGPLNI